MNIGSYSFGKIVIEGKKYTNDLILFPDRIETNWWREQGHLLQVQDLEQVFREDPDILIVGKGSSGRMDISQKVKDRCREKGIELKSKKTEQATEIYNKLKEEREVVAAFHLTC